jgi:CBS domain-containing protein
MKKASDIMTRSLITCGPDTSVGEVARLMRNGDAGNVLVTKDDKLVGIVTDRDIAVQMASDKDPRDLPVRSIMSTHPVTGQTHWSLDKIASTMSKHQIRRLPIVDRGMLLGIISLGDLARRDGQHGRIVKSLFHISEPHEIHRQHSGFRPLALASLVLGLITAAGIILTLSPRGLRAVREEVDFGHLGEDLNGLVAKGRERIASLV